MLIALLMIFAGIWMTRWANQFEAQRRKELFDHWKIQKKITNDALKQLAAYKKDSNQVLQAMSDRINQVEDPKESVLNDFKRMLYGKDSQI